MDARLRLEDFNTEAQRSQRSQRFFQGLHSAMHLLKPLFLSVSSVSLWFNPCYFDLEGLGASSAARQRYQLATLR